MTQKLSMISSDDSPVDPCDRKNATRTFSRQKPLMQEYHTGQVDQELPICLLTHPKL